MQGFSLRSVLLMSDRIGTASVLILVILTTLAVG
jgi:hypothetical protein